MNKLGSYVRNQKLVKMSLLMAGGLEPDDLLGPFQPLPFYDSMILRIQAFDKTKTQPPGQRGPDHKCSMHRA